MHAQTLQNRIFLCCLFLFCLSPLLVKAQLQTNGSSTPAQLVQNTLLGPGVTASNIVWTGDPRAIGFFNGSASNIGLGSGIIINTGTIHNTTTLGMQDGPFGPNNLGGGGLDNNGGSDFQLEAIAGGQTFNAASIEFDFIPTGDSVSFRYVFASEEYLEFVNAGYNDVFAFFISGPGISGVQNIARIPGSNIPVAIDNVNASSNSFYYIDNGDGSSAPQNSDPTVVQYDGFTKVLEAVSAVQPCQTYHIRIAIADVGDGIYDSGVFLEAASFSSEPQVEVEATLNHQPYGNNTTMAEGCTQATVTFTRNGNISSAASYPLIVSGTATPGTDCDPLPNVVNFPAGASTSTLVIDAYQDAIPEGDETLRMSIVDSGACNVDSSSVLLTIRDVAPMSISGQNDTLWCAGSDITINATVSGGLPAYQYNWSNGGNSASIIVSPTVTTDYTLTASDNCGNTVSQTFTIVVPPPVPLSLSLTKDTVLSCPSMPVDLMANVSGGGQPYTYVWSHGPSNAATTVTPSNTTTYTVTIIDGCGQTTSDSVTVTIDYNPITIETIPDQTICPGEPVYLNVFAQGGRGDYKYDWNNGESFNQEYLVFPTTTTVYTVEVSDSCGTYIVTGVINVYVEKPDAAFVQSPLAQEVNKPVRFENLSTGASSYYWDLGNGETGTDTDMMTSYEEEGEYDVMLIAYDDKGCSDTMRITITIYPEFQLYVPNAFTPNGDGKNDAFFAKGESVAEYEMIIYDRWGNQLFRTEEVFGEWDGTTNGIETPLGVYVWVIRAKPFARPLVEKRGHVTLVR